MPHPAAILLTLTPSEQREFLPKPLLEAVRSLATLFEYLDILPQRNFSAP